MGTNQVLRKIAEESAVEKICREAYRESEFLKENGKKLDENIQFEPFFIKHIVSTKDEPVSLDNFQNFDPTVKTTAGFFSIKYIPESMRKYKNKPYVIGQDLIRMRVLATGYKNWRAMCNRIEELGWIARWCPGLTPELFGIAKRHAGTSFYFSPDWVAYSDVIYKKAEERGIDIDKKAFVTYAARQEVVAKINETHFLAPERIYSDVEDIVKDLDTTYNKEEEDL